MNAGRFLLGNQEACIRRMQDELQRLETAQYARWASEARTQHERELIARRIRYLKASLANMGSSPGGRGR